jgi:hypothetical protein
MPINGEGDAEVFLKQLAKSSLTYHLDDDPREIHGREIGDKISVALDRCFHFLGETKLWEIYGEAVGV